MIELGDQLGGMNVSTPSASMKLSSTSLAKAWVYAGRAALVGQSSVGAAKLSMPKRSWTGICFAWSAAATACARCGRT